MDAGSNTINVGGGGIIKRDVSAVFLRGRPEIQQRPAMGRAVHPEHNWNDNSTTAEREWIHSSRYHKKRPLLRELT